MVVALPFLFDRRAGWCICWSQVSALFLYSCQRLRCSPGPGFNASLMRIVANIKKENVACACPILVWARRPLGSFPLLPPLREGPRL